MKTEQEIKSLVADRDYIFMFMEELEQADAFWLWHRYASKHRQEKAVWGYHFKIFSVAIFHASLLSARKLNDFFTGRRGKPDDIKADRYGFQNMERSEEHTSELQSHSDLVCRLLLEKKTKSANCCVTVRPVQRRTHHT